MSFPSPRELLARPLVRLACAVLGAGVLALAVWGAGAQAVLTGLGESLHALPLVAALEALFLLCSVLALRALYGEDAARVSARQWLRAGALGYALGAVLPIGRASAEAARAVLLGRTVGGARAAVAAVQIQGVTLLANAVLSTLAAGAALTLLGFGAISMLILANALLTAVLGLAILLVREHARPGRLLGAVTKRGRAFGLQFDATAGASRRGLLRAGAWECTARGVQLVQCAVALAAIRHPSSLGGALVARGMLTVGSSLGDFIPAQLGATEATLVLGATALGLTAASAAALALLIQGAQLSLALLCTLLTVVIPGQRRVSAAALELGPP
ncbi:MAG: lysylphosphatidylglycerol synthase domain-containing protein [Myxococcaceae bacterium]